MTQHRSFFTGVAALAIVVLLTCIEPSRAQIGAGSGGIALGGGSISAGDVVRRGGLAVGATRGPTGPGLSRLPLTTPQVMPYLTTTGDASRVGPAGSSSDSGFAPQAFGTEPEQWPYSMARIAVTGAPGVSNNAAQVPVTSRHFRLTGKLWMKFGSAWFVCSASLIKPGLLVTAAHCVHNFGQGAAGWATNVRWHPANLNSSANGGPFGFYNAVDLIIPETYFNGTDTCHNFANGIVCNNDIAIVALAQKNGKLPGVTLGGTYHYGWNGYSFTTSPAFGDHFIADLTQLGYPVAFDDGYQMQRNNSFGKYITSMTTTTGEQLLNTQLGTAMTGGSSGGPWLVNFGTKPKITDSGSATFGMQHGINRVVGVTSWGYTDIDVKVQGASWFGQNAEFPNADYGGFGAGNIGRLVQVACTTYPGRC